MLPKNKGNPNSLVPLSTNWHQLNSILHVMALDVTMTGNEAKGIWMYVKEMALGMSMLYGSV